MVKKHFCFIHEFWGALLKTPWPKLSLGENAK